MTSSPSPFQFAVQPSANANTVSVAAATLFAKFIKKLGIPTLVVSLICLIYVVAILAKAQGDPLEFVFYDGHYSFQITYRLFGEAASMPDAYPYAHKIPDAYRLQRILYPLVARLLALGWPSLIPWTLILVNLIAITAGTWITERLLHHYGVSNWYALVYGLHASNLVVLRSDMTDALAQTLVMLAIWAWVQHKHRWQIFWFALAMLTKETAFLFIAAYGLYSLQQRNWRKAMGLGISLVPYFLWQIFLLNWLGEFGFTSGQPIVWLPFGGWLMSLEISWQAFLLISLLIIPLALIPTLAGLIISIKSIVQGFFHPYAYAILFNALFMLFLPHLTYRESSAVIRVVQGLTISLLLFGALTKSKRILNYSILWLFANVIVISSI
ncbi:MAG: hypothetical protein KC445_10375 [Anaerolineales bacterium]|nr:hypothetical protein [Anaerolineales bacterium]